MDSQPALLRTLNRKGDSSSSDDVAGPEPRSSSWSEACHAIEPVEEYRPRDASMAEETLCAGIRQIGVLCKRSRATPDACGDLRGDSVSMCEVFRQIRLIAPLDLTIMIEGESGTGKELAARAIHELSGRSGLFVAMNCGAVASELLASLLFGHERGSFTGAIRDHRGLFEQAEHGTLFLDEITEMPYSLQAHLLRVLESGVIRRVGGNQERPIDCRVVAATNCDSRRAVSEGRLREDLFYRLMDFPLVLPPLRERPDDIFPLAQHFLDMLNSRHESMHCFAETTEADLKAYAWPGNVRELKQVVRRAYILCSEKPIRVELPNGNRAGSAGDRGSVHFQVGMTFDEIEEQMLRRTLEYFDNDKTRAAETLGISLKTIYNRLSRCEFGRNRLDSGCVDS